MGELENMAAALRLLHQSGEPGKLADLQSAATALEHALRLDPTNIELLRAATRFYSIQLPDPEKAREYARLCRAEAHKLLSEMDEILGPDERKAPPSARHIGGIIGPY